MLELPAAAHQRKFYSRTFVRATYCMAERGCSRKAASIIAFARQPADLSVGWPANEIGRGRELGEEYAPPVPFSCSFWTTGDGPNRRSFPELGDRCRRLKLPDLPILMFDAKDAKRVGGSLGVRAKIEAHPPRVASL